MGIESLTLESNGLIVSVDSTTVMGLGEFTFTEGYGTDSTGTFADVSFSYGEYGIKQTVDGNMILGSGDEDVIFYSGDDHDVQVQMDGVFFTGMVTGGGADVLTAGSVLAERLGAEHHRTDTLRRDGLAKLVSGRARAVCPDE